MTNEFVIDALRSDDRPAVRQIYLEGLATGHASFEIDALDWEAWDAAHLPHSRLVARGPNGIAGWVALSPVSQRACYAGVAEVSYYVAAANRGHGIGQALLQAVIRSSEAHGIWTLTAGVFPENSASLRLLEGQGFRILGRRERIGQLFGVWRDVVLAERRSALIEFL